MSLVAARGPLGPDPGGWFSAPLPDDLVYVEPHPWRVQAIRNGRVVIDTERALMVHRRNRPLSYAFPADVIADLPNEAEPEAPGYVVVPWDAVDTWLEEGRQLVHYPPNPYNRVDCRPTDRRLRVDVAGTTLVDTLDTVIVSRRRSNLGYASHHRWSGWTCCGALRRPAIATTRGLRPIGRRLSGTLWSRTLPEATTIHHRRPCPSGNTLSFDAARTEVYADLPGSR